LGSDGRTGENPERGTIGLTVDVEADGGGFPESGRTFESFRILPRLIEALGERGVPLTAFVEGEILERRPELIDPLIAYGAVVESHAWDHSAVAADLPARIANLERGLEAYRGRLGVPAAGFRAPYGIIGAEEIARLSRAGVRYDASVFPCFFPGRFNNFSTPRTPYRHAGTDLPELPFGALGGSRFPLGLSFVQLIGWHAFRALFTLSPKPPCFIFNFHLHDLWRGDWPFRSDVPASLRLGYRATLRGDPFGVLMRFLDFGIRQGYGFDTTRAWLSRLNVPSLPEYPARTV
jgi:hypothetical protein